MKSTVTVPVLETTYADSAMHQSVAPSSYSLATVPSQQLARSFPQPAAALTVTRPVPATAVQSATVTSDVTVVSISDIVRYFKKRWKLATMIALPLAALAFLSLGFGQKVFEAEARLLLRIQDTNVFNFTEMTQNRITELSAPMLVNNHRSELKARRYVDYLWEQFTDDERAGFIKTELAANGVKSWHRVLREKAGLAAPLKPATPKDLFCDKMDKAVRVEPLKDSHVLRVQVRHSDAKMAALVANHYVEYYIRYVSEQELGVTKTASHYLEKKSAELQKRLAESEKQLASNRQSENLMQEGEVKEMYGEKVRLLMAALADAEVKLTRTKHDLETIRNAKTAGRDLLEMKAVAENSDVSAMRKQLDLKLAERAPLMADCGPNHPKMRALNESIETLQNTLMHNIGDVVAMLTAEEENGARQVADFQRQLDEARTKVFSLSGKTAQDNLLRDQVAMDRNLYQTILLRMNQAELTGEFKENGLLRVADMASPPGTPASPSMALAGIAGIMVFGLVFLGVPLGCGLAEDHLMPAFRAGHVAEHPPVAPVIQTAPPVQEAFYPQAPVLPISHSGCASVIETEESVVAVLPDVQAPNPASLLIAMMRTGAHGAGAALRQVAASLEKNRWMRSGPGVVMVTSAEAREGKSLVSSALAATFTSQGRKAFLIECNPTSPSAQLWYPNVRSDAAAAHDVESLRYGSTNLFVLPASGLPSTQVSDLIDGYRFWIDRARQAGIDWIILDTAPLLRSFADVAPLIPGVTDVLFVHDQTVSSKAQVQAALSLMRPLMGHDVSRGLVMNRQVM
ncbi:MAG: hypothetical protein K1X78_28085 [Verrucomicrobiaceae bacterium]|nr:hypothetical protein [Verrucomicrobiaceae bacterium]